MKKAAGKIWLVSLLIILMNYQHATALPYANRAITLAAGSLRFDGAPSDFGLQNSGLIGNNRGFRIHRGEAQTDTAFGLGLSYGITSAFEIGALLLDMTVTPEANWRSNALYARYGLLRGRQHVALQLTGIRPDMGQYGVGVAIPILLHMGQHGRLDTGVEVESLFGMQVANVGTDESRQNRTQVNIDVPVAFSYNMTDRFFSGFFSGLFVPNRAFDHMRFPLGVQGGYLMADGDLDILISLSLERFVELGEKNPFHIREFLFNVGISYRFDLID